MSLEKQPPLAAKTTETATEMAKALYRWCDRYGVALPQNIYDAMKVLMNDDIPWDDADFARAEEFESEFQRRELK